MTDEDRKLLEDWRIVRPSRPGRPTTAYLERPCGKKTERWAIVWFDPSPNTCFELYRHYPDREQNRYVAVGVFPVLIAALWALAAIPPGEKL